MVINQRVRVALATGRDVILCAGETLEQREADQTDPVLDPATHAGIGRPAGGYRGPPEHRVRPVWGIGSLKHHATRCQTHVDGALIGRQLECRPVSGHRMDWDQ